MKIKLIFGATISIILLFIYVYLVWFGIDIVVCADTQGCASPKPEAYNDHMISSLSLVGGLISALVIAELAVTKVGQAPAARLLTQQQQDEKTLANKVLQIVTGVYLVVWLLTGLSAFFYGYLLHPGILPSLGAVGHAWFGVAVGAGYAYFGIEQK